MSKRISIERGRAESEVHARNMIPFATRDEAWYWGGGVLAEDRHGGWWSLHARTTPNGVELGHVGRDEAGKVSQAPGFPNNRLVHCHVFATPADGGPRCICISE
jgi:hypothetical protein